MTKLTPFFLNILLLNKDEVVASAVGQKTGLKSGFLGKAAAFAANKLVTDEKVINNLAETLIEKCTNSVAEMGISATFSKVYQQHAFVVIKVQIEDVDQLALILAAKGPDFAGSFTSLLSSITALGLSDSVIPTIDAKVLGLLHSGMMTKFSEVIPVKMAASGLNVDCCVKSSAEEAEYFFDFLEHIK